MAEPDPLPPDRLWRLSTFRLALRHGGYTTPEALLATTGKQRNQLAHAAEILKLVRTADPDVMLALFLPRVPVDWEVAGLDSDPDGRILIVGKSAGARVHEYLVNLSYRVDDDGSQERRAWALLLAALRAAT